MATFLKSTDCHGLRGTRTKIRRKTTAQAGRLLGTWIQQALHGRPEPVHHLGAGLEGPQQDRSAYDLDLWCPLARLFWTGHYPISHQNQCEIAMNSRKTQKRTLKTNHKQQRLNLLKLCCYSYSGATVCKKLIISKKFNDENMQNKYLQIICIYFTYKDRPRHIRERSFQFFFGSMGS